MKKIICLMMSVIMLIGVTAGLNMNVYAEQGTCGEGVSWEYNSDTQVLSITGTGEMMDFENIEANNSPWKPYREAAKSIIIAEGVTKIGNYAFTFFKSVKEISVPKSVNYIGDYAFYMCTGLENVKILGPVTELRGHLFSRCIALKSISLPSSVKSIGKYAFESCSALKDIYFDGSQEQWEKGVTIDKTNSTVISNAAVHYNSAQPDVDNTSTTAATTTTTTKAPAASNSTSTSKPKATSISKLTKGKKQFKVSWKKVSGVTGYQVQYSTNKKFKKGNKTVTVKGAKKANTTVKKLKAKKTYYVRVRTYKTKNSKKTYSAWSKVKSVKTK